MAPVKADPNKVLSVEEAVKALTEGKEEPLTYTVQEGDTISGIAKLYDTTQAEIFKNNPTVKELTLQIGDTLQLTVPQPALTVVTVEQVAEQVVTEPEVVVRTSDQLAAGKSKVVRPGQTGLKTMQYRLTKENGQVVKEEWLGQAVVKASLPEVVYRGTKVVGEGTGMFVWPVSGATISSSYGERWGRVHKGVDLVSGNRTIKAADAGTVSFAGVQNGYGNVVIVDHHNGYSTYYGHLSRISVSQGQRLEQGAQIGIMGNTGRSTGTHLHFEIRKNGTAINPMRFLQ
ncbi:Murein hydrolase activator NlpD precursor [compost metagenome]